MKDILSFILTLILQAPENERNKLAQMIEDYATTYRRSYRAVSGCFAGFFMDLEEALDIRIEHN